MITFLLSLIPAALVEITSFARLGLLGVFLSSRNRPIAKGISFVVGTFVCYMGLGILFAIGLGQVLEKAGSALADRLVNPDSLDYVISLIIGLGLLVVAVRQARRKPPAAESPISAAVPDDDESRDSKGGLVAPLLTGIGSNAIVGPNTLCTFAAFGQILKADFGIATTLLVLVFYNLMVVSPLVGCVWLSAVNRERAERFFEKLRRGSGRWGRRIVPVLCFLIGLVMVIDAVGFFLGHPLLPTGPSSP